MLRNPRQEYAMYLEAWGKRIGSVDAIYCDPKEYPLSLAGLLYPTKKHVKWIIIFFMQNKFKKYENVTVYHEHIKFIEEVER